MLLIWGGLGDFQGSVGSGIGFVGAEVGCSVVSWVPVKVESCLWYHDAFVDGVGGGRCKVIVNLCGIDKVACRDRDHVVIGGRLGVIAGAQFVEKVVADRGLGVLKAVA